MSIYTASYDRQRYEPVPTDTSYIHLRDLMDQLRPRLENATGRWLDFGSGTSPYRVFFGGDELVVADVPEESSEGRIAGVDLVITPGEACPAPDGSFDGILSTQVLEHIPDSDAYLVDALRMLRPGGELVLSTHGIWEDHPCPFDLRRWTAQGLRWDLEKAGFEVSECVGVSRGPRALLMLMERWTLMVQFPLPRRDIVRGMLKREIRPATDLLLLSGVLRILRRLAERSPGSFGNYADGYLNGAETEDHPFYLDLLIVGRKPLLDATDQGGL